MNESKSVLKPSSESNEAKKPWVIYLMAIWSFFGIGSYLSTIVRVIGRDNQALLQFGCIGVLLFAIALIVYVLRMNRVAIILFGCLCMALALWQTVNVANVLISQGTGNPIVYLFLYYIIPSTILAIVALRPSFLKNATQYTKNKKYGSPSHDNS